MIDTKTNNRQNRIQSIVWRNENTQGEENYSACILYLYEITKDTICKKQEHDETKKEQAEDIREFLEIKKNYSGNGKAH